jgi:diacylglycerol kinase (ATP)
MGQRGTTQTLQIVVTPGSGEGRALRTARRLRRRLRRRGHRCSIETFGNLPALARWASACDPAFSHLVCVGGDATLSAAATAAVRLKVPFVPVPNGFGNVFAQVFGHSDRVREVVRLLDDGEVRKVDVGKAGEEMFLSHRSYGFLDQIQESVEDGRQQPRGRLARHLAYYTAAPRLLGQPLRSIRVEVDGAVVAEDAVLVTVANVETYRGFLSLTPKASPVDGRFDVFVVPRTSKARLGLILLRLLLRLPGRWNGVALYRGRRVAVEVGGRRDDLRVERRVLPLLVPAGAIERIKQRIVEEDAPVY